MAAQIGNSIDNGWYHLAKRYPSTHFNERPEHSPIDLLVVHNISLPPGQFGGGEIQEFFCGSLDFERHPYFQTIKDLRVSAHCLIDREGEVSQFVPFQKRAWHAGQSNFDGLDDCNNFSIGIELEGTDTEPYTTKQYDALIHLTLCLIECYPGINLDRIVGHCDIAPTRKTDPGPAFDWQYYRKRLDDQIKLGKCQGQ